MPLLYCWGGLLKRLNSSSVRTLKCWHSPPWRPHLNKYKNNTPRGGAEAAVLLSAGRWPPPPPTPPVWILHEFPFSFHHSLMSSCSCQHLLTASNSLRHTGSWDPCDELQSAVCSGGFTLSQANQGKHPLPRGRASTDRLSPSYPVITLPLSLCCKLPRPKPLSSRTDTLMITFQSVYQLSTTSVRPLHSYSSFFLLVLKTFLRGHSIWHFVMPPTVTQFKCLLPQVSIISDSVQSLEGTSRGLLNFIKASTADYLEWGAQVGAF